MGVGMGGMLLAPQVHLMAKEGRGGEKSSSYRGI